jgi:hypothetical protein
VQGFAGCNSDTPAKSRRDELTAQKERLVNELSDMATNFLLKSQSKSESDVEEASKYKKTIRIGLGSLCGALESKDAAVGVKELFANSENSLSSQALEALLLRLIDVKEPMDDADKKALLEQMKKQMLPLPSKSGDKEIKITEPEIDLFLNKMLDLIKVINKIRELD